MSTEFNRGWWCCFNAFATHLLSYRQYSSPNEQDIIDVVKAAGINAEEIRDALGSDEIGFDSTVVQWLRDYLSAL